MFYHYHQGRVVKSGLPAAGSVNVSETVKRGSTPKGTGAYQIVKLTIGQQIKLADWIKGRKNELQAERPRRQDVATRAAKELGFAVTECSVRTIARAVDCHWTERTDRKNSKSPYTLLKARIARLEAQTHALRDGLIELMAAAGSAVPASLQSEWPGRPAAE